jgi:hypothetical protein
MEIKTAMESRAKTGEDHGNEEMKIVQREPFGNGKKKSVNDFRVLESVNERMI